MSTELPRRAASAETITNARRAVDHAPLLDTEEAIEKAVSECAAAHTVGLDTEFVRERTFHARPGLVQLSDGRKVWLLDAVAVPRSPSLGQLLSDEQTVKVLHSVGEDLEILQTVGGSWPAPLFDTQVAAALLGMPLQLRYEHLVEAALGVELDGGKARNDWCRRPLKPELLHYAAEDVIWLPQLKEWLEELLDQAGRLEWHREECARLVEAARAGDTTPPLSRVKGAGRLSTPDLARLDALAQWREGAAHRKDLPRRFVMADDTLIDLAEAAGENRLGEAVDRLPRGQKKRFATEIETALERAPIESFKRPGWIDALTPEQREQLKQAQQTIRAIAEELGIEPAVIASKRELTRLIRGERPEWLDGWRGRLLDGRLEAASVSISAR